MNVLYLPKLFFFVVLSLLAWTKGSEGTTQLITSQTHARVWHLRMGNIPREFLRSSLSMGRWPIWYKSQNLRVKLEASNLVCSSRLRGGGMDPDIDEIVHGRASSGSEDDEDDCFDEKDGDLPDEGLEFMYSAEVETKQPHLVRPIVCDADIPRGGPRHQVFTQDMVLQATHDLREQDAELSVLTQMESETTDPMDEFFPPMHAQNIIPEVTRNMTEDEFYFSRDYRPGYYWPVPSSWSVVKEDAERGPSGLRTIMAPDGYCISAKGHDRPPARTKGWKEREALALVPWMRRNAVMANLSVYEPQQGDVRVPEQQESVRKGLKALRQTHGGRVVVWDGDHWPSRELTVKLEQGSVTRVDGANGQPRVWGQWTVRGRHGEGGMGGIVCAYITRASAKPTVMVCGGGLWDIDMCELRTKGGAALVATDRCKLSMSLCGIGGLGKGDNVATNGMSVHGDCNVRMLPGCVVEWTDLGGARFYGQCNATVTGLEVRDVGWYGILVDHNATLTAWDCKVKRCGKGAFATSIKAEGCALFAGNNTIGKGVNEWWGPQRPGKVVALKEAPVDGMIWGRNMTENDVLGATDESCT